MIIVVKQSISFPGTDYCKGLYEYQTNKKSRDIGGGDTVKSERKKDINKRSPEAMRK